MFNKFAAALIAASLFTAPALAGNAASVNAKPGAQSTVTVKVIKKHNKMKRHSKHARVVKHVHVKHVRHAKRIRHHHVVTKHVVSKPAMVRTN